MKRLLGKTYDELNHELHSVCCSTRKCWVLVTTKGCVKARINNLARSYRELTGWCASQLEAFDTRDKVFEYRIKGKRVCKNMWQRYHGLGRDTLRRAVHLFDKNKRVYGRGGKLAGRICQDDWVFAIMFQYFEEHCETIADGIWHLQKVDDFDRMYEYIVAQWAVEIPGIGTPPGPPPPKDKVKVAKKRDWSFVKEMRKGEYELCGICWDLHEEREAGFQGETQAKAWKAKNDLHHKIHQICRRNSVQRQRQAAVANQFYSCWTDDMSRPFYLPSARRVLDDFKNRHVLSILWGGAICFASATEFILVRGPEVEHGANAHISYMYHLLRWDLFNPETTAANELDMEVDDGPDNTAKSFTMFLCHLAKKGWKDRVRSNRMVRHHTHNIQDQRFYTVRYFGWNKSFITTNFAQKLSNMLLGYRRTGNKVVMLLLIQNYDWDEYFKPCWNKNARQTTRPLGWEYIKPETGDEMPKCFYKQYGDASAKARGDMGKVDGDPLFLYTREPTRSKPEPLPKHNWVTTKVKADIEFIISQNYCGKEEAAWLREIVLTLSFTRIVYDGAEGEGGLPGKPAHLSCKDKRGREWRADFRVLSDLPTDLWALPPSRYQKRLERDHLTEQEEKKMAHTIISTSEPTPRHPIGYPGARELTQEEKKGWSFEEADEVEAVKAFLEEEGQTLEKFGKSRKITIGQMKQYCRKFHLPLGGKKAVIAKVVWEHHFNPNTETAEKVDDEGERDDLESSQDEEQFKLICS